MDKLNLEVTIDQANLILEALGELPFSRVYQLISELQAQAGKQMSSEDSGVTELATSTTSSHG